MYVCMYIYMHTYIHTYLHIYIYTYAYIGGAYLIALHTELVCAQYVYQAIEGQEMRYDVLACSKIFGLVSGAPA